MALIEKYLGTILVGRKVIIDFPLKEKLVIAKDAKGKPKIIKSCGCTKVKIQDDMVKIMYTPPPKPKHLVSISDYYIATKTVTIYHIVNGGQKEITFKFTAKVI